MADPISLLIGGLGLLGLGAGASSALSGSSSAATAPAATPAAAPAPKAAAPPIMSPVGSASSLKTSNTPSFLAAAAAPQTQNIGAKTLLGQ